MSQGNGRLFSKTKERRITIADELNRRDLNNIPTVAGVDSVTGEIVIFKFTDGKLDVSSVISGDVSIAPLTTIYNGSKTVPTGTAEAIASSQSISSVTVKALSTNTVAVYVGATGCTAANGFELLAGESVSLDIDNLADVFVISGTADQVVRYIGL